MTKPASSTAPDLSGATVPAPRTEAPGTPAAHAAAGLAVVRRLSGRLDGVVAALDERIAAGPSLLPDWNRLHVLSHLARNADALVNLLTWAQTGVEHPMYPSRADRDADIEEGAHRMLRVVQEDLSAATDRLTAAADNLAESAWETPVVGSRGLRVKAGQVPWMRAVELLVHSADLDRGLDFTGGAELAGDGLTGVLDQIASMWQGRDEIPALRIEAALPSGEHRVLLIGPADARAEVSGPVGPVLGWLTGRTTGTGLTGTPPDLPAWL